MLLLRQPQPDRIRRFLKDQRDAGFTYRDVGATDAQPPAGYVVDHTRVRLGEGRKVFAAARSALENWRQFQLGWVRAWPDDAPIRDGQVVAVVARSLGLCWLNACRIVYVIDEDPPGKAFGFAYGTLPDHVESGEERFLIEMDQAETVWYDIVAFSRPRHTLARIGYPFVRRIQKRFARQSAAAMGHAVQFALEGEATIQ